MHPRCLAPDEKLQERGRKQYLSGACESGEIDIFLLETKGGESTGSRIVLSFTFAYRTRIEHLVSHRTLCQSDGYHHEPGSRSKLSFTFVSGTRIEHLVSTKTLCQSDDYHREPGSRSVLSFTFACGTRIEHLAGSLDK
ncbi:hypothetical protein B296_00005237 [Ensete ventricosum]|uniref:Uncharacterized protein n=1 Tax=Ensete ventricosum TaxID=4639 RepID=A0A427APX8_ENSVE|nr:hypothetical protein B296_00005237 [Ensete ventricosum]